MGYARRKLRQYRTIKRPCNVSRNVPSFTLGSVTTVYSTAFKDPKHEHVKKGNLEIRNNFNLPRADKLTHGNSEVGQRQSKHLVVS